MTLPTVKQIKNLPLTPLQLVRGGQFSPDGFSSQEAAVQARVRLTWGHSVTDFYAGVLIPLVPVFSMALGFSMGQAGLIFMLSTFASNLLQPLYGWLGDRYGRANLTGIALAMAAIALSLIGFAPSTWVLCLCVLVGYVGVGLFHPAATVLTHRLSNIKNRNFAMGCFIAAGNAGFSFGPALSGLVVERFGLHSTWLLIVPGLIVVPILWSAQALAKQAESHTSASELTVVSVRAPAEEEALPPEVRRFNLIAIMKLCFINTCRGAVLMVLPSFLPFLWKEQGYSLPVIGLVIGLSGLIGYPFGLYFGRLADRIGEKRAILYSLLPGLGLLPLMVYTTGWVSLTAFVILAGFYQATVATTVVKAFHYTPGQKSKVSGWVSGFSFGLVGFGMPLFGWLSEHIGMTNALMLLMLPVFLGLLTTWSLPKSEGGSPAEEIPPTSPEVENLVTV